MGQYYRFINLDKKQKCERSKYMLKLTEHSYLGNKYCSDILSLLSNKWKGDRVIHVGDYAEGNDGTTTEELIATIEKENGLSKKEYTVYDWGNTFEDVKPEKDSSNIRYVYNLDKKEFVDLLKQPVQWLCYEENQIYVAKFNSFALLIGCGNEQGGGDYYTKNKEKIGLWAGDHFVSSTTRIKDYEHFKEIKPIFNEMLTLKSRIKNYNEKSTKEILFKEGVELKDYLAYLKKANKIDFTKLRLDKADLLDNEYNYLNIVLNKIKTKELRKQSINKNMQR